MDSEVKYLDLSWATPLNSLSQGSHCDRHCHFIFVPRFLPIVFFFYVPLAWTPHWGMEALEWGSHSASKGYFLKGPSSPLFLVLPADSHSLINHHKMEAYTSAP